VLHYAAQLDRATGGGCTPYRRSRVRFPQWCHSIATSIAAAARMVVLGPSLNLGPENGGARALTSPIKTRTASVESGPQLPPHKVTVDGGK